RRRPSGSPALGSEASWPFQQAPRASEEADALEEAIGARRKLVREGLALALDPGKPAVVELQREHEPAMGDREAVAHELHVGAVLDHVFVRALSPRRRRGLADRPRQD